jgi:hypothetical protein
MCGNLTAYVDQFKGLAHQLKVGELVDLSKKYYKDSHKKQDEDIELTEEEEAEIELTYTHISFLNNGQMVSKFIEEHDEEPGYVSVLAEDVGEGHDNHVETPAVE